MRFWFIVFVLFLNVLVGCDSRAQRAQKEESAANSLNIQSASNISASPSSREKNTDPPFKPFYVFFDKGSRENHYVPSGFMPNGKCLALDDSWKENCKSGDTCIKIIYDLECSRRDQKWAGIYWLNPPNNWGNRKGGFSLTGAQKLTFWARGEKGGEQIQEFTVGGISGNYADSDTAVLGMVILSSRTIFPSRTSI